MDDALLEILVCPITHATLIHDGDWLYSTDRDDRRKYPIRDGIPIMLIDESQMADEAEYDRVMTKARSTGTESQL